MNQYPPRQPSYINAYRLRQLAMIMAYQTGAEVSDCARTLRVADFRNPKVSKGKKFRIAKSLIESRQIQNAEMN